MYLSMYLSMVIYLHRYVLMSEPDHIMMRPLPNFMRGDRPAAYNFGYMNPVDRESRPIVKRCEQRRTRG